MERAIVLIKSHKQQQQQQEDDEHAVEAPHLCLKLVLKEKPHPLPHQVLIRITIRPVNPIDLICSRTTRFTSNHINPIIGSEGFGLIEEIGPNVTRFKPGQRVVPFVWPDYLASGQGSWQDYVVMNEKNVFLVPDGVTDEAAAQFIINPWTAFGLLDDLAVPKGEYIVQTAAASALGRQVIQIAKHWGIKTINIVRRDHQKDELMAIGADEVLNFTTEDVVTRVKEITKGKLAYGAIDAVSGELTKSVAASVRDDGRVLVYGVLSDWDIKVSILDLLRGVQISWWMLSKYLVREEKRDRAACEVMKLLESRVVIPQAGKKLKFEDFQAAIVEAETEGRRGKVLLVS